MSEKRIYILGEIVIVLVLSLVLVSTLSIKTVHAQAGQVTLNPSDDTYVDSDNPTSNYGEQPYLQIRYVPEYPLLGAFWPRSVVWLKFNLSSVPDGAVVDMTTLQLHTSSVNDTFDVNAYSCSDNSWNESTLTYSNMPTVLRTASMDSVVVTTNDQWYNWSVFSAVTDALNNTAKTLTLSLWESVLYPSNTSLWFDSKEATVNSTHYSPRLTIHWSEVVPEFPTFLFLPFFMMTTLIGVALYKKKAMRYRAL